MNDSQTYVDERDLVIFYQILSTTPQLGAVLYRQELGEAVRAWLSDVWNDAPVREQRWLTALYLYYGLVDGEPLEYREVAVRLRKSPSTVRDRAARGLRYLWGVTHVRDGGKTLQELYELALVVNEWPTDDPSQEVSLTFFEIKMDENADIYTLGRTPTAEDMEEQPPRPNLNGADRREPNLWNPEWRGAETAPDRIIMKGGVLL